MIDGDRRGSTAMTTQTGANFDATELQDRVRRLRTRFDEFRGRL